MQKAASHSKETAFNLEDGLEHKQYYDDWASSYDTEFAEAEGYVYPAAVASRFFELAANGDAPVADIGCGTGLVGLEFSGSAFEIDGFDISPGMLKEAERKGAFRRLTEFDLLDGKGLPAAAYGGLVSCGTFTLGHLGPDGLENSLVLARPGALCIIGINALHFEQDGFYEMFRRLRLERRTTAPDFEMAQIYSSAHDASELVNWAKLAIFRKLR